MKRLIAVRVRASALAGVALILSMPVAALADVGAVNAVADTEQQDPNGMLTEIVVTAEKRPTNLQKTPISISVLGANDIQNRHVQSLLDLSNGAIPSLRVAPFFSRNSALIVNIRGIGVLSDGNQPARDQGVGIYVDGIYLGRPQGLGAALYDIESIEVLKGPQGTLFGRNTEGGAVSITTRKPTGEFHVSLLGGVGNFGSYKTEAHVDLPEFHNFSLKIDGIVTARDGTVKNPLSGAWGFNAYDRRGLHTQLQWKPAPNFTANYSYDTSYDASSSLYQQAIAGGTQPRAPVLPLQPDRTSTASVGVPEQPSIGKNSGHGLFLEWQVAPSLTLKSISSYRKLSQSQFDNAAATTATLPGALAAGGQFARYSLAEFYQHQYSQEFQAIGDLGRIHYVVGAMGFHEHVRDNAQAFYTMQLNGDGTVATVLPPPSSTTAAIPVNVPGAPVDRASRISTDSYGVFGQFTWTPGILEDNLHLTAGARWTNDRKNGELYIVNNKLPVDAYGVSRILTFKKSWSRVDPMVNLAYDVTRDVHLYGKWSTGYKSGGANSRSLSYMPFNPEKVSIFEIGAKTEFFDRHVRLNVSAYTGTYKDIQLDFAAPYYNFDAAGNPITAGTTRTTLDTYNAPGNGRVKGVEAELMVAPVRGLTLSASYAYTYVRIPDTSNPYPTFVEGKGMVVNTTPIRIYTTYTPRNALSGAIDWERSLSGFTLSGHLDANYDDGFYTASTAPVFKGDASTIFNGRIAVSDIGLGAGETKLTVSLWARNLFNEQHRFYISGNAASGLTSFFNEPRTFGIEAQVKF
ncbi:TonB-dependent receptor [Sphingomonas quercus]|uniref:TonB-dependent receptor n=1 Tax=Sphingomonas quercus TaxID=2842451 RepID=A0ABS6BHC7_9SPHN|nr:TonB-dependent receptor [Sphingomonas quercus]MBU3077584.1 TonB-dependent receptor [Sphingomonas quercus]